MIILATVWKEEEVDANRPVRRLLQQFRGEMMTLVLSDDIGNRKKWTNMMASLRK